ncbi:hypothetical protein [Dactylosporangium sp. NPDC048998]|uniref:hypothetical protein n=1 Tax=Dactylosporangium sp. NPDC048998 TaxID=3363976 RepID=UPI003713C769
MVGEPGDAPVRAALSGEQQHRWSTVLAHLIAALPDDDARVAVDGFDGGAGVFADQLAARLRAAGRHCVRLTAETCATDDGWQTRIPGAVVIADGVRSGDRLPATAWHLTVWVRTPPAGPAQRGYGGEHADAVVDLHDPAWPVLRHLNPALASGDSWYRTEPVLRPSAARTGWHLTSYDDPAHRFHAMAVRT